MEISLRLSSSFLLGALGGFGLLWLSLKIDLNAMPKSGFLILIVALIIFITAAQLFIRKVIAPEETLHRSLYYAVFITPLFLIFFGGLIFFS